MYVCTYLQRRGADVGYCLETSYSMYTHVTNVSYVYRAGFAIPHRYRPSRHSRSGQLGMPTCRMYTLPMHIATVRLLCAILPKTQRYSLDTLFDIATANCNISQRTHHQVLHGVLSKPAIVLMRQRHKTICVRVMRTVCHSLHIIVRPSSSPPLWPPGGCRWPWLCRYASHTHHLCTSRYQGEQLSL